MVKIYIKNIKNIKNIDSLKKYLKKTSTFIKLYSLDGIYHIENNQIYYHESILEENIKNISYNEFDLLFDYTDECKIRVISQLPVNYIISHLIRYEYQYNNMKLIINGINENNPNIYKKKNLLDVTPSIFIPIDYYFEYNDKFIQNKECIKNSNFKEKEIDIKNTFFQEELNVFLSKFI